MHIKPTHLDLIKSPEGDTILSLLSDQTSHSYLLTPDLLNQLNEQMTNIFDPERSFHQHLKTLKEFKRQVFTHYRQEKDPNVKQQKLELYIETKKLVDQLENSFQGGSVL